MSNKQTISNENIQTNDKIDDYYDTMYKQYIKQQHTITKKLEKIDGENIHIPVFHEYEMLSRFNYNVQQLKKIAKHYKLKLSGNKPQLVTRIYSFLFLSNLTVKIQKITRGMLVRKYFKLHGPGFLTRSLCTNTSDFLTMEPLDDLSFEQFFSFKDEDNFIYGFDLQSIYNLIYKTKGPIKNPYNRHIIPVSVVETFRSLLRLSKILKIDVLTNIKEDDISIKKAIELRTVSLFQNIDLLGNYSNPKWFLDLNREQLVKIMIELLDIWAYRAHLSISTKRAICPPHGNPFPPGQTMNGLRFVENIDDIRQTVLITLEKLVNSGVDRDSQCLGAYYVLGALTLVNVDAASSLPWLYQALN
jgi:hypothetical protein